MGDGDHISCLGGRAYCSEACMSLRVTVRSFWIFLPGLERPHVNSIVIFGHAHIFDLNSCFTLATEFSKCGAAIFRTMWRMGTQAHSAELRTTQVAGDPSMTFGPSSRSHSH
jgi:hypothetical protein